MTGTGPHIVVVGAGIIGASIAWRLASAGARVTIVTAGQPGGVATPNSFSWINSNYSFAESYFALRHHSMGEWRRLADALPGLPVALSGSIYLPAGELDLETFVARNGEWGYRIELIDGENVRELEPALKLEMDIAAWAHDEGAAEAEEVAVFLTRSAVGSGTELRTETEIVGLAFSGGHVSGVRLADEVLQADEVVVAAGVATPGLIAETGYNIPLISPPGLLVHTKPVEKVLERVILADGLHVRQKANGELLGGSDFQGAELAESPEDGAALLMGRMAAALETPEPLELSRTTTGYRPTPEDGFPVVGRVPGTSGLYVAVMHSGVTLCPAIGAMVRDELLSGDRHALLAPFGPERFLAEARVSARV